MWWIVLLVVVLIIGGVLLWLYWGSNDHSDIVP